MKNEMNQGMKGVLSHSGDGSCCANFTMNASDQNTEEPSPCVGEQVLSFKRVSMRTLVLLACNCGQIDKASNNIADAFAFIVDAPVYAADGEVKNRTFWSHDGDTQKGWYEYRGGRGIYSSAGDGYLNWEEIYGSN